MASRQLSRAANIYRQYMTTQLSEEATEVISSDPASPTIMKIIIYLPLLHDYTDEYLCQKYYY